MLDGSTQPLRDLRRALSGRPRIVVVEGLDALTPGSALEGASVALRDAAANAPGLVVLVSTTRPDAARALLVDAGWTEIGEVDVTVPEAAPSEPEPAGSTADTDDPESLLFPRRDAAPTDASATEVHA